MVQRRTAGRRPAVARASGHKDDIALWPPNLAHSTSGDIKYLRCVGSEHALSRRARCRHRRMIGVLIGLFSEAASVKAIAVFDFNG